MRLLYKTGPMESLRKWFYKPKRDDRSLLAQFFFADDALNMVASELDSFDGRKDPERCSTLVNQLRHAQDRVLNITSQIMDQLLGDERVARGFRVKFPEDVLQDNLAGQLWFGAECLAAGSSIMNREEESAAMRPLAKALTRSLETVRSLLREQCLRPRALALTQHDSMLHESLRIFDRLFAEFELCYVSAMVNVKTPHEFESQQLICVLFSESLRRALKQGLLTQEQVDSYDPALMFAVPRLAIVSGLLIYSSGPLSIEKSPEEMSDMFRPFRTLLHKIRSLLWTLDRRELMALERLLCTNEDVSSLATLEIPQTTDNLDDQYPDIGEFVSRFYADHAHCKDLYTQPSSSEPTITEADYLPDNIEVMTPILDGLKRLTENADIGHESDHESHGTNASNQEIARHYSTDSSVDTFQNENKDFLDTKVRKTSKNDNSDLASLRNLSTSGLNMFDPLVINAVSTSETNRQLPDNDLVTSLNEQVTEIADRLSSIVTSEVDLLENQIHSYSNIDVPTLITTESNDIFSGPRNEQLSCLPSTSHGYLIPNAISQEPVVLASLSHNNSAIFNQEEDSSDIGAMSGEIPLIIPDSINIDAEIVNTNTTYANAHLSSLLLTNEEFRNNYVDDNDNTSFHSAKMTMDKEESVKFKLGYESDNESPVDSGVSTENTSLDRSPDTDQSKELKENHYMQNRVMTDESDTKNSLERSFPNVNNDVLNINYIEETTQKCEAGTSHIDSVINNNTNTNNNNNHRLSSDDEEGNGKKIFQDWGANVPETEMKTIDEVITELRRQRLNSYADETNRNTENPPQSTSRQRKSRKSGKKKKRSKMWSPGVVILDNRSASQNSPLKLNLDHFVDESSSTCLSECADDEQIAVALQAQELAARQHARGKFKSSEDLIHRLFVCIAGVADQLQTNFAADLRNILKSVFAMNQTSDMADTPEPTEGLEYQLAEEQVLQQNGTGSSFDSVYSAEEVYADSGSDHSARLQSAASTGDLTCSRAEGTSDVERAPEWVPDIAAAACMRCGAHFTAFRRRHHCRNCGKVFCASCSSNSIPLPRFGQLKPVRVCEECFQNVAIDSRRYQPSQR